MEEARSHTIAVAGRGMLNLEDWTKGASWIYNSRISPRGILLSHLEAPALEKQNGMESTVKLSPHLNHREYAGKC